MEKSQKTNLSSLQVIKTLKALLEGEYMMPELVHILNEREGRPVFNSSVVSKYINTCRQCGIGLPKISNRYIITQMPFGLKLSMNDLDLIKGLQIIIANEMSEASQKIFEVFSTKINRYTGRKIVKVDKTNINLSYELFERAVSQKRKVRLVFKNGVLLDCIPLCVLHLNDKKFFSVFNKRTRIISENRLSGIEMLGAKYYDLPPDQDVTVIFKLKGNLAKRYEIRPNEICDECSDGTKLITNKGEAKEILFSRLMRYDDKCEILSPEPYREEFKQFICDTLKNYGV